MHCPVKRENRTGDQISASQETHLMTFAALTAEVGALKQDLERFEQELGRAKKQLEDKEGD